MAHLLRDVGLAFCVSRGSSVAFHARLCEGGIACRSTFALLLLLAIRFNDAGQGRNSVFHDFG